MNPHLIFKIKSEKKHTEFLHKFWAELSLNVKPEFWEPILPGNLYLLFLIEKIIIWTDINIFFSSFLSGHKGQCLVTTFIWCLGPLQMVLRFHVLQQLKLKLLHANSVSHTFESIPRALSTNVCSLGCWVFLNISIYLSLLYVSKLIKSEWSYYLEELFTQLKYL